MVRCGYTIVTPSPPVGDFGDSISSLVCLVDWDLELDDENHFFLSANDHFFCFDVREVFGELPKTI